MLPKLSGKILTMKDFTTVLTMHREARGEILAQLREVYDGSYSKSFGTGEEKRWEGHVGLLAGVTEVIDAQTAVHSILGERFILYRPQTDLEDRKQIARRAIENVGSEKIIRKTLQEAVQEFIRSLGALEGVDVAMSETFKEAIATLADLTAKGRAAVPRDGYSRLVLYTPQPETPARLAKQFSLLAKGIAIIRGGREVMAEDLAVIRRLAQDTMIRQRVFVLKALTRNFSEWTETKTIAQEIRHPSKTALKHLEDCFILRLVERDIEVAEGEERGRGSSIPYRWRLTVRLAEDIQESGIFQDEPQF